MDRTNGDFGGLITDLDSKLGRDGTWPTDPVIIEDYVATRRALTHGLPTWIVFFAVTALVLGVGLLTVQPWKDRCSYSADLCRVERLDIDALRVAIPDSQLIATLPNIDALDPDDILTAGDVFDMDRFKDIDFEALITQEEIDTLLRYIE